MARTLVNDTSLILVDEPMGNLDRKSGRELMKLFVELNEEGGAIVMMTHNPEIARCARDIVELSEMATLSRALSLRTAQRVSTNPESVPCLEC